MNVKAELRETNFFTRYYCHVCGGCTEKVAILTEVPDGEYEGFRVCERCLEAGDIPAKMCKHADELNEFAEELRKLAPALEVPSRDEYQAAERRYEEKWRAAEAVAE